MTCVLRPGHRVWEGDVDAEGHRTYSVEWLVEADVTDGPYNVMRCPGLPIPGVIWALRNDIDQWAFCLATKSARVIEGPKKGSPTFLWTVKQTFSSKPPGGSGGGRQRCQDTEIENPILEPPEISVAYNKQSVEITHDLYGFRVTNSAWEPVRGPQMEFDENQGVIKIKQNVSSFFQGVILPNRFIDCVNDRPIWGFGTRCVKLSAAPADRKLFGQCEVYWARTLEFETNSRTFDRNVLDEGTKVLHGRWNTAGAWELLDINGLEPDRTDPSHFDQFKDKNGENCRVILNGRGLPSGVITTRSQALTVYYIRIATTGTGQPLTNTSVWVRVVDGTFIWLFDRVYNRGNIVIYDPADPDAGAPGPNSEYYICLTDNTASRPDVDTTNWAFLQSGIMDDGIFSLTTEYSTGSRVRETPDGDEEEAGSIFVAKYPAVNFLLLGVPAVLG